MIVVSSKEYLKVLQMMRAVQDEKLSELLNLLRSLQETEDNAMLVSASQVKGEG